VIAQGELPSKEVGHASTTSGGQRSTGSSFEVMLGRIALLSVPTGQMDGGQVSSGTRLQRVERCCKYRFGALQMKLVHNVASRRNGGTVAAIFEAKKEIPASDVPKETGCPMPSV
jgi:hypothetical protein